MEVYPRRVGSAHRLEPVRWAEPTLQTGYVSSCRSPNCGAWLKSRPKIPIAVFGFLQSLRDDDDLSFDPPINTFVSSVFFTVCQKAEDQSVIG